MKDKILLRRIERIEGLLGNEKQSYKLSPALQEAVDRICGREEAPPGTTPVTITKPTERTSNEPLSPALQEAVDRIVGRFEKEEKGDKRDE